MEMFSYVGFKLHDGERAERAFSLRPRCSCLPRQIKVAWHLLMAAACLMSLVFTFVLSSEPAKYLIFMTSWGLVFATAAFVLQLANSFVRWMQGDYFRPDNEYNAVEKTLVVLLNVNASLCILITATYWTQLYPTLSAENRSSGFADKLLGHGLVALLVLLDLVVFSTRPIRWQHFYQPLCAILAYYTFSAVYFLAGGRGYLRHAASAEMKELGGNPYIYQSLDWRKPGSALGQAALAAAALVLVHLLLSALDWGLRLAFEKCRISDKEGDQQKVGGGKHEGRDGGGETSSFIKDSKREISVV